MINYISIKNIALIEQSEIFFNSGLNVLSGETGAGKSVILDSINFVLGAKADKTMIRYGQQFCLVECCFTNFSCKINDILTEFDIESGNELIIKRKFDVNGNGYIKVNGENVTATMLKKITGILVDVHGQSEHYLLMNKTKQLECIDSLSDKIDQIKQQIKPKIAQLKQIQSQLSGFGGNEQDRAKRLDLLNFQINEIQTANLVSGEEERLLDVKKRLLNCEKLSNAFGGTHCALSDDGGALDILGSAMQCLNSVTNLDENYLNLYERLKNARAEISDISDSLDSLLDGLDFEDVNPDVIEQRLETYKNLKRKYGFNVDEINEFCKNACDERDNLLNYDNLTLQLRQKEQILKAEIYDLYIKLSNIRQKTAKIFSEGVIKKLRQLAMPHADFQIEFSPLLQVDQVENFSDNGIDKVEFTFSANLGEPVKPLSKIISGGEMSRFMLALKSQAGSECDTYIFDEIDAGISGDTAYTVAQNFADISQKKQIIAISHLPQISAFSDSSFLVKKFEQESKTYTDILPLEKEQKVWEVVRLIGGKADDEIAIKHANNMIDSAENYKKQLKNC